MDVKSRGKFWWGTWHMHYLKVSPHRRLGETEGTKTVIVGEHLHRMIKINITYVVPDVIPPGHNSTYIVSQPRIHNFNLIMRKQQTNTKWGIFYFKKGKEKTIPFKNVDVIKDKEILRQCSRSKGFKRHNKGGTYWQCEYFLFAVSHLFYYLRDGENTRNCNKRVICSVHIYFQLLSNTKSIPVTVNIGEFSFEVKAGQMKSASWLTPTASAEGWHL